MRNTKLKLAIVERGESQVALAEKLRIPEGRLSRIVNGWTRPLRDERRRIAEVLERDVVELFGPEPPVVPEPSATAEAVAS